MAVAAALILATAVALIGRRHPASSVKNVVSESQDLLRPDSLAALSRMTRESPEAFDQQLDSLGSQVLPDVQGSDGVLHRLAHR